MCQEQFIGNGGKPLRLSPKQIYAAARKAGFSAVEATTVTAIALAESGGVANVLNDCPATGDYSWGLMQVNMIGNLASPRLQEFGIAAPSALTDPAVNMRAAYMLSGHGGNFTPWSTYKSGAYMGYEGQAQAVAREAAHGGQHWYDTVLQSIPVVGTYADTFINPGAPGLSLPGFPNPLGWTVALARVLSNLLNPKFWLRIGQGLASVALLLIGAGLVFRRDVTAVIKQAPKLAPEAMAL